MYRVEVSNKGDSLFNVKSKDCEFTVDTKGEGVTPPDTLLASLGSCVGVYIRKYAEGSKLDIKEFCVTVEADFAKEAPAAFRNINVSIDLQGAGIDERRRKAMLEFVKNCPVHNTLEAKPVIDIKIKS